jgi:hypothetical protein
MVVERVTALEPAHIARGPDSPMVHPIMRRYITEVPDHHSPCEPKGHVGARNQQHGQRYKGEKNEQTEPCRRTNECHLVSVVNIVLVLNPFYVVEDIPVEQIFDQAP